MNQDVISNLPEDLMAAQRALMKNAQPLTFKSMDFTLSLFELQLKTARGLLDWASRQSTSEQDSPQTSTDPSAWMRSMFGIGNGIGNGNVSSRAAPAVENWQNISTSMTDMWSSALKQTPMFGEAMTAMLSPWQAWQRNAGEAMRAAEDAGGVASGTATGIAGSAARKAAETVETDSEPRASTRSRRERSAS